MCNNREFGAILEQSYFHSVPYLVQYYSIFSCLALAMLKWGLQYHEGGYYLWQFQEIFFKYL